MTFDYLRAGWAHFCAGLVRPSKLNNLVLRGRQPCEVDASLLLAKAEKIMERSIELRNPAAYDLALKWRSAIFEADLAGRQWGPGAKMGAEQFNRVIGHTEGDKDTDDFPVFTGLASQALDKINQALSYNGEVLHIRPPAFYDLPEDGRTLHLLHTTVAHALHYIHPSAYYPQVIGILGARQYLDEMQTPRGFMPKATVQKLAAMVGYRAPSAEAYTGNPLAKAELPYLTGTFHRNLTAWANKEAIDPYRLQTSWQEVTKGPAH
jgi:hypothetical protein